MKTIQLTKPQSSLKMPPFSIMRSSIDVTMHGDADDNAPYHYDSITITIIAISNQLTNNLMRMQLLHQYDIAKSFWWDNIATFASQVRWAVVPDPVGVKLRKFIWWGVRLPFSIGYPWLRKIWSKTYLWLRTISLLRAHSYMILSYFSPNIPLGIEIFRKYSIIYPSNANFYGFW